MLYTAEVRWFLPGALPASLVERFHSAELTLGREHTADLVREEPARIDTYLVMPGSEVVGVKLRQGMFEIKAQCSPASATRFTDSCAGLADTWCKLSMAAQELDAGSIWPEDRNLARHVMKRRHLRRYLASDAIVSEPILAAASSGCNFEVTEVGLVDGNEADRATPVGEPFHSLSFEAFGATTGIEAVRDRCVPAVLALLGPAALGLDLSEASSHSYPAWLTRHA